MIARKKWVKGVVTSVGDGDGFRLYHTPGPFWNWPLKLRRVPVGAKDSPVSHFVNSEGKIYSLMGSDPISLHFMSFSHLSTP